MDLFHWLKSAREERGQTEEPMPEGPRGPLARRRYRFSGVVQGVGFRYEAKMLADRLGLTGWARNEDDGTVTVEIEGEADAIGRFLRAMRAVRRFSIMDVREEDLPPSGREKAFRILY